MKSGRFCAGLLIGFASIAAGSSVLTGEGVTSDDIAIFTTVLARGCPESDKSYLVVSDMPSSAKDAHLPPGWPEHEKLAEALKARSSAHAVWPHADICRQVKVAEAIKIKKAFDADHRIPTGWDDFHRAFPGAFGLFEVSLPAYTQDGYAAVYTAGRCDVLCGTGFYVLLQKTGSEWNVIRTEDAWIS